MQHVNNSRITVEKSTQLSEELKFLAYNNLVPTNSCYDGYNMEKTRGAIQHSKAVFVSIPWKTRNHTTKQTEHQI